MVGGCGFVVAARLAVHVQQGSALKSVACVVRVITLVTQVSGIGQVCLAINAVGLLRSSTNNKISVCGWCKFGLFVFSSLVIMSLSLEEGVDVEVGSEEWEERFLEKLLVRLKETVKEKEVGVPQLGASGSGPSSSQSEGG